jgi:hypothetical protein
VTPPNANLRAIVDELANALQVVVLIAEHLERISSTTGQDAAAITRNLQRVTAALAKLRTPGGAS